MRSTKSGPGRCSDSLGIVLQTMVQQAFGFGPKQFANGGRHEWRLSDMGPAGRSLEGADTASGPASWMNANKMAFYHQGPGAGPLTSSPGQHCEKRPVGKIGRPDPTR